jgi:hypothetical protein
VSVAIAAALVAFAAGLLLPRPRRPVRQEDRDEPCRRILLPFAGDAISRRSLEAAVRLAHAEDAVIMPAFLARVPRHLPMDAPLPYQSERGMPLLEAIEQRATAHGVAVDSRVGRGRTYRQALAGLLDDESFDRIIVPATTDPRTGLGVRDLEWLLSRAPAEVMILRPAPEDERRISAAGVTGHF